MKVQLFGSEIRVWDPDTTKHWLGWRKIKSEDFYRVEDNIVNRLVLGLSIQSLMASTSLAPIRVQGLRDYQVKDVRKGLALKHYLNANPMGLGKTLEAITYIDSIQAQNVLIVCPKIIRTQWADQLVSWIDRQATLYESQNRVTGGFWIVNYDKLRRASTLEKFRSVHWDCVILDEAHKIKNRNAKQTIAVKRLPAIHRIALTGTPILRYPDDLWSILNFLDPWYSGKSYWNFRNYFCNIRETDWGEVVEGLTLDTYKCTILNRVLDLVAIRNSGVEVAYGKTQSVVSLPMSAKQKSLYKQEKSLLLYELPENCTIPNGAVLTMRLRQTTSWPGLFIPGEAGPKFEWILEMCLDNPSEKVLVFSVFEQTVSALQQYLIRNGVSAASITGKNTHIENETSRLGFLKGAVQVLIGTLGAMGQGFDGLQRVCRTVVFVDRDWIPALVDQAEDRLHRMGQTLPVLVYYLECTGSIDRHVGRINLSRSEDIRRALQDD